MVPVKSQPAAPKGQPASGNRDTSPSAALVDRALANELNAAQDQTHPMRFQLRKSSPRLTRTQEIFETRDGAVARLIAVNDNPLNPADEQVEEARLNELLIDPARQHHRKQSEDADAARALKVLRMLPTAFVYQYAGSGQYAGQGQGPAETVERFIFRPNPGFSPPDLETQALTAMAGEIWIDPVHERVVRLEGHLEQDVDFGWGILGRLNKGGWITIEQADVGGGQWRAVRFKMAMSGRVFFKNRVFDTTEEQTQFAPLPSGLTYQQAIQKLMAGQ